MTFMKLTLKEFDQAIEGMNLEERSITIAKLVLVEGQSQSDVCKTMNLTRGAVSQTVKKVVSSYNIIKNDGEFVSVVLPKHQAYIVREWAKQFAAQSIGGANENSRDCKPKRGGR